MMADFKTQKGLVQFLFNPVKNRKNLQLSVRSLFKVLFVRIQHLEPFIYEINIYESLLFTRYGNIYKLDFFRIYEQSITEPH